MNPNDLFGEILIEGSKKLGLNIGIISQITGQTYKVLASVINGHATTPDDNFSIRQGSKFQLAETYCSDVIRDNETKSYADVENFSSLLKHPCYQAHQLRSYIGTPLVLDNKVFGTLNFSSPEPRQLVFSKEEVEYLEQMAGVVSKILQKQLAKPLSTEN